MMSNRKLDVLTIGDLMVDFTPAGISPKNNLLFERNPGGSPANVAVTVSRLGGESGFLGTVSNDIFGQFLKSKMVEYGVCADGIKFTDKAAVKMAFITLDQDNNRSFYFTKGDIAETFYYPEDVDASLIKNAKVLMLSLVSQYNEPFKSASAFAVKTAKENDVLIAYDPNWNIAFSKDKENERKIILNTAAQADIMKISIEEAMFVFGEDVSAVSAAENFKKLGPKLVTITLGPKGNYYLYDGGSGFVPTYDTKVADTTGAGDAFMGGLLYQLTNIKNVDISNITNDEMQSIMHFSNACGAICATKRGGMPSLDGIDEVFECMEHTPILQIND